MEMIPFLKSVCRIFIEPVTVEFRIAKRFNSFGVVSLKLRRLAAVSLELIIGLVWGLEALVSIAF